MRCVTVAIVTCGALALAACGGSASSPPPPAPTVKTAPATVRRVAVRLPFLGRAEAARSIALRALVEGRVTRVAIPDGARVAAGDAIFELGGDRVASRRQALRSAVGQAEASLEASVKRVEQARRRADGHLAGPGEVTAAEAAEAAARGALAQARSTLERFEEALTVEAPVSGSFVGRRVSSGQDVLAGEILGEILEAGAVRIAAAVVPRPGLDPAPGQAAEVERRGGEALRARVHALRPEAGAAGTVRVWLTGDALRGLAPGTAVRGFLVTAVHEKAVTVPRSAVVRDRSDGALLFVGSEPPFERREVTTGEAGPGWIEITSGLEPGEKVVTEGAYELYWAGFAEEFKVED